VTTAAEILILTGLGLLVLGVLTGVAMSSERQRGPTANRYLTLAHLAAYMQAPILFGLVLALELSDLTPWVETLAAVLSGGGAVLLVLKDTVNWRQGTVDEFVERSLGFRIAVPMVACQLGGLVLISFGAVRGA
jgi:hypothetical protein